MFNLRQLWVSSANTSDLSLVFTSGAGEPRNIFLGTEYLAVLETRQGTPYFLNLHRDDVGHSVVLGAIGSGKSFFLCFLVAQIQKYNPFTFIFDLGGSYKSLTALLGGTYLKIGPESSGVSINPFCLSLTKENHQFLFSFVRVLAESSGYHLNTQDERDLYSQIGNLYEIDPSQRRLGTLANILNRPLGEALGKWVGSGQYGKVFDNAEDKLTFSRFQAFDFEGLERVPELLEPLLFYVLHRASTAVQDARNATILKAFVVDEAWRFFRNPIIRGYITEALKTWRKRNAVMILATQSSDDLLRSEMLATVAESSLRNSSSRIREWILMHIAKFFISTGPKPVRFALLSQRRNCSSSEEISQKSCASMWTRKATGSTRTTLTTTCERNKCSDSLA